MSAHPAPDSLLAFNGVDGATGGYLLPPMSPDQLSGIVRGESPDPALAKELSWWHHRFSEPTFAPVEGVDPKDLAQTGWGVVFAAGTDAAVREALKELLDHRRAAAGGRYKEFTAELAYRPGESKRDFLARHGAGPGPVDPDKVPYYLLLVGDPESLPYSFQYQLDVQYGVGRIHFDSVEEYRAYAHNVVAAETSPPRRPPIVSFFAVQNPDDRATGLSTSELVAPLAEKLSATTAGRFKVQTDAASAATKDRLGQLLGGDATPGLLFTASHGVGFPKGHASQARHQGALLCQDWLGPVQHKGPLEPKHYFSADDVAAEADLSGLLAFHFACYGAGTPRYDEFAAQSGVQGASSATRPELAAGAFVSALPKRLLSHPAGGALAVIGHVERAWGYSFLWPGAGRQTAVYESCLARLLDGHPVGSAFEYFNQRYAELSSDLSVVLEDIKYGKAPDHMELGAMWTENNDARGFAVVGDPAVRLAVTT